MYLQRPSLLPCHAALVFFCGVQSMRWGCVKQLHPKLSVATAATFMLLFTCQTTSPPLPSHLQGSPFGASVGLVHAVFAMAFSPGPEPKPWDTLKGYSTVHGMTRVKGTTFADFMGSAGCGVSGSPMSSAAQPVSLLPSFSLSNTHS